MNNLIIAMVIPFLLSSILQSNANVYLINILLPVLITISIPLAIAQVIKYIFPKLWQGLLQWQSISFYVLVLNVYIAVSGASYFIQRDLSGNYLSVVPFMITSTVICAISFSIGWLLGRKQFPLEAGQALGQKNNAFTIWLALIFISPMAVLGPVFYVFAQNIYISLQLYGNKSKEI